MGIEVINDAIADLHVHTTVSDGVFSPHEVLAAAKSKRLTTLAISDHHTTHGFDAIAPYADKIDIIPAVEISTSDYKGLHILGYGMTRRDELETTLSSIRTDNIRELFNIIGRLESVGVHLPEKFVNDLVAKDAIGRKAIAQKVIEMGKSKNLEEVYRDYHPHFQVETKKPTAAEAINLISRGGGVAGLAHPYSVVHRGTSKKITQDETEELVEKLTNVGLKGIECLSRRQEKKSKLQFYAAVATNHGLFATGGSDFHGIHPGEFIGNQGVKPAHLERLKDEIAKSNTRITRRDQPLLDR
jgi:predicted metal-dependent phosphoesterase TrpH